MERRSMRLANKHANTRKANQGQPKQEQSSPTNVDPNLLAAVNQAVATILPQILGNVMQIVQQQQPTQEEHGNDNNILGEANQTGDNDGVAQSTTAIYVWLERFQKLRPLSFSSALTPVEADDWIAHMDKIFDFLDCSDNQKVRLAAYQLEGDAQRWWRALKLAKGGDAYVEALTWTEFCKVFYQQYFPAADKEAYTREYASIRQKENESVNDYLARFVRLASLLGSAAGTKLEQVEKFKWTVHYKYRPILINEKFIDVVQAANAAKNIEMERLDFQMGRPQSSKKRHRDGNQFQSPGQQGQSSGDQGGNQSGQWNWCVGQQGQNQNRVYQQQWPDHQQGENQGPYPGQAGGGNPNLFPGAPCSTCGRHHRGRPCYRAIGACFRCGQVGHFARDCTNPRNDVRRGNRGSNGNDGSSGD